SISGAPFALDVGATVVGLGSRTTVRSDGGEAKVGHGFGTLDFALRFDRGAILQPVVGIGAGAYSVDIEGQSAGDSIGHEQRTWSMFTSAGAGLWIQPSPGFAIELDGQLGRAWSKTIVRIAEQEVAETGSPLLVLSVSAMGSF